MGLRLNVDFGGFPDIIKKREAKPNVHNRYDIHDLMVYQIKAQHQINLILPCIRDEYSQSMSWYEIDLFVLSIVDAVGINRIRTSWGSNSSKWIL